MCTTCYHVYDYISEYYQQVISEDVSEKDEVSEITERNEKESKQKSSDFVSGTGYSTPFRNQDLDID